MNDHFCVHHGVIGEYFAKISSSQGRSLIMAWIKSRPMMKSCGIPLSDEGYLDSLECRMVIDNDDITIEGTCIANEYFDVNHVAHLFCC